jgi:hypothetical protein
MSLAMQIFVIFFLILDMLGVFSCILSVHLGFALCASNEIPLLVLKKVQWRKANVL